MLFLPQFFTRTAFSSPISTPTTAHNFIPSAHPCLHSPSQTTPPPRSPDIPPTPIQTASRRTASISSSSRAALQPHLHLLHQRHSSPSRTQRPHPTAPSTNPSAPLDTWTAPAGAAGVRAPTPEDASTAPWRGGRNSARMCGIVLREVWGCCCRHSRRRRRGWRWDLRRLRWSRMGRGRCWRGRR